MNVFNFVAKIGKNYGIQIARHCGLDPQSQQFGDTETSSV